jgi:hypothetical protein
MRRRYGMTQHSHEPSTLPNLNVMSINERASRLDGLRIAGDVQHNWGTINAPTGTENICTVDIRHLISDPA